MAVVIRLSRRGAKKRPFYRVVATDSRSPRDGKFLEVLGTYDPLKAEDQVHIDTDKAQSWLKKGALPSR
ncbi:MAG: 30S ribosomal protein S16, partial [Nitrospinaceae bacterium]|nr:30S ribosomal protein S16 [Nitrospinaceae bacterium]NIR53263.1 30S ribosomal protein S16 [Nitrospinaceae bacterium]NIS83661.1 30S ribosomal protein S16 [Nitrospinaceae bacterium]NIT80450.1 30S ribosomal protein S16 [Nitrospinaceae bacterium]NIU42788.1 30S ribosomal protein S16 [Nitrospinaceae bacterium]